MRNKSLSSRLIVVSLTGLLCISLWGCSAQPDHSASSEQQPTAGEATPSSEPEEGDESASSAGEEGAEAQANDVELLETAAYTISYTLELQYPDFTYSLKQSQSHLGDNFAMHTEGEVPLIGYTNTTVIIGDGVTYYLDGVEKTYFASPYGDLGEFDDGEGAVGGGGVIPANLTNITFVGEEEFNGVVCSYAEQETETGPMRFYFNARKQFVGIKGKALTTDSTLENPIYIDMYAYVESIRPAMPADFEIPNGYTSLT